MCSVLSFFCILYVPSSIHSLCNGDALFLVRMNLFTYRKKKLLITSFVSSSSSDRFFTISYISFLYLNKHKIHAFCHQSKFQKFEKKGQGEERGMFGAHDRDSDFWTINYGYKMNKFKTYLTWVLNHRVTIVDCHRHGSKMHHVYKEQHRECFKSFYHLSAACHQGGHSKAFFFFSIRNRCQQFWNFIWY